MLRRRIAVSDNGFQDGSVLKNKDIEDPQLLEGNFGSHWQHFVPSDKGPRSQDGPQ